MTDAAEVRNMMRTTRLPAGMLYEVVSADGLKPLWSKYVEFKSRATHRAGGPAFVDAAREQEKQATIAKIAKGQS